MPTYNVFWKAIQPNGSSNSSQKTVTTSSSRYAEDQVKAEVQQKFPNANVIITDVKER